MQPKNLKLAYSVAEVAEAIGLAEVTVRDRVKRGVLPARKDGERILILPNELHDYLNALPRVGDPKETAE